MTRGFTLFFAVLVAGLALSIGLAIYDLTIRELNLSDTVTQSEYAIYAADTGAECALYWDSKCIASSCSGGSAFATSTLYTGAAASSGLSCNSIDITNNSLSGWTVTSNANAATTTFTISFSPLPYCATITVSKTGNPSATSVVSHGYNVCAGTGNLQLERVLQVNY